MTPHPPSPQADGDPGDRATRECVLDFLADFCCLPEADDILPTTELRTCDAIGSSLDDVIEFQLALEDEFQIRITDGDMDALRTVEDVVRYIERRSA